MWSAMVIFCSWLKLIFSCSLHSWSWGRQKAALLLECHAWHEELSIILFGLCGTVPFLQVFIPQSTMLISTHRFVLLAGEWGTWPEICAPQSFLECQVLWRKSFPGQLSDLFPWKMTFMRCEIALLPFTDRDNSCIRDEDKPLKWPNKHKQLDGNGKADR